LQARPVLILCFKYIPMRRRVVSAAAAVATGAAACFVGRPPAAHCHANHESSQVPRFPTQKRDDSRASTGQGEMVFSWDRRLTDAMPADARVHENKMHGCFSEDAETGIEINCIRSGKRGRPG
jgi:hypothetical protein